jgi:phosphoribosylglycinamide formyltransferase-1
MTFFLLIETNFHISYLVTEWMKYFAACPEFMGIAVREDAQLAKGRALRESLHQEFQGQHNLSNAALQRFKDAYPSLSQTDLAMIRLFGVPEHSATFAQGTKFLGPDLNSHETWQWLSEVSQDTVPVLFIFLDQLLQSWWLECTHGQIINGHSAHLPYARGMYAIENIAITQDIRAFSRAAGATVHYIDTGIDTGPIVKAENLAEPFDCDSIWEVKALSFQRVFRLLIQTALDMLENQCLPPGISSDPSLRGPNFNSRNFTVEARKKAEEGYLRMKMAAKILSGIY